MNSLTWPQASALMAMDRESMNSTGHEEYNSIAEAIEALAEEKNWVLSDGE